MWTRFVTIVMRNNLPLLAKVGIFLTCLSFGLYLVTFYYKAQDDAARRLALRNLPPQTVAIDEFQPERDTGLAREVSIVARLDPAYAVRRHLLLDGAVRSALVVPVLAPTSDTTGVSQVILGSIIVRLRRGESDAEALRRTLHGPTSVGPVGQVFRIDGQRLVNPPFSLRVGESFAEYGRTIQRPLLLMEPFDGSRSAALSRDTSFTYGRILMWLSIVLATMSTFILVLRDRDGAGQAMPAILPHRQTFQRFPNASKAKKGFVPLKEQEKLEDESRDNDASLFRGWLSFLLRWRSP